MQRTHTIAVYDDGAGGSDEDSHGNSVSSWAVVVPSVGANLQPLTGSVTQSAAGREINATWKGFVPPGTVIREGNGILVLAGVGPQRFRVVQVGEQGGRWDTELMLSETEEVFP